MQNIAIVDRHELEQLIEGRVARGLETALAPISKDLATLRDITLMQQGILTRNALCDLLDVSVDTVRRYEAKGLRVYRPGRSPLYLLDDVVAFIRQHPDTELKLAA